MRRPLILPAFFLLGLLLYGCTPGEERPPDPQAEGEVAGDPAADGASSGADTLTWDEDAVRSPGGEVLLTSDDFPRSVEVSPDASFGAGTRITAARAAPGGGRIALTTSGAAHGFGWILDADAQSPRLVAFQYGGAVRLHGWDPTGRYVAFVTETPRPGTYVWIADVASQGEYPEERGFAVEPPGGIDARSEERAPTNLEWIETELCFLYVDRSGAAPRAAGGTGGGRDPSPAEGHCVDPETREVRPL